MSDNDEARSSEPTLLRPAEGHGAPALQRRSCATEEHRRRASASVAPQPCRRGRRSWRRCYRRRAGAMDGTAAAQPPLAAVLEPWTALPPPSRRSQAPPERRRARLCSSKSRPPSLPSSFPAASYAIARPGHQSRSEPPAPRPAEEHGAPASADAAPQHSIFSSSTPERTAPPSTAHPAPRPRLPSAPSPFCHVVATRARSRSRRPSFLPFSLSFLCFFRWIQAAAPLHGRPRRGPLHQRPGRSLLPSDSLSPLSLSSLLCLSPLVFDGSHSR
jgi:hypothetical protein